MFYEKTNSFLYLNKYIGSRNTIYILIHTSAFWERHYSFRNLFGNGLLLAKDPVRNLSPNPIKYV